MSSAAAELVRAPDVAGEIVGFRAWRVTATPRRMRLTSVYHDVHWGARDWTVAECHREYRDLGDVPHKQCRCGIYAARDLEHLVHLGYNDDEDYDLVAIGEVGLAGKVIPAEQGWRAEKARPIHLLVPYEHWQLARPLSLTYRIPVELTNVLRP